ncbi:MULTISPECIES: type II toxin-antitoxin system PemK/MazF family toxin [unclassified Staphylococcus]|uniref:type II toxin-antitoxin system PemK/MazF family toxin n=1 Tax=unclassified Staphylococcus TaxID=91994 RepID=UPI0021CE7E4F|nr:MULTISPECIES: type II toxin-antitoxin system PemK/MazF family toxin [unclassified Staphylococcus]UXR79387.1 type II toxin-antitoxin system PemK/MazF family toxin [Staphylococcus sp. IVB6227]UXR83509.1 type II toxin-antitoxin system PemK/MazF family toxin [Staphylococcus sp. IVB6214]
MRINSPQEYVGKIVKIRLPYFNSKTNQVSYKSRPALIIGCEKKQFPCDFTYLPISKVTSESNRHLFYDFEIDENNGSHLNLHHTPSFIRCHKVGTAHCSEVSKNTISDLSKLRPDVFDEIKSIFETYTMDLF